MSAKNTVFVYDDVDGFLEGYRRALEDEGWEVQTAESADRALQILNNGQEFDLYVLDLLEGPRQLPRGVDLLRALNPRQTRRKVIILTSSDDTTHADEASELGAWSFIVKQRDINPARAIELTCQRLVRKVKEAAIALEERRACRLAEDLWTQMTSPEIPPLPGLSVASMLCQKHRRFGGDFYWAQTNEARDALTVLLGDITDKGPSAALIALLGLAALQMACGTPRVNQELIELLLRANKNWFQLTRGLKAVQKYYIEASALYLRREETHWIATTACCGSPPLVLVRGGEKRDVLDRGCSWLGITEKLELQAEQRVLYPGDIIVLVTDGLYPTGNRSLRAAMEPGEWCARLETIVRENGENLSDAAQAILGNFSGDPPEDDRSVVLIRCE